MELIITLKWVKRNKNNKTKVGTKAQNAIYFMKIGPVLSKLQLFKVEIQIFCRMTWFYIKGDIITKRTLNSSANIHFSDPETSMDKNIAEQNRVYLLVSLFSVAGSGLTRNVRLEFYVKYI